MSFVSDWVKQEYRPCRKCVEPGCGGSVYYCRDRWAGDVSWGVYQCDRCGAGFESAGHWCVPIPRQVGDYEHFKPGTPAAVERGCTCERDQPGPPKPYLCDGNCPIHGAAEFAAYLRNPNEPRPQEASDVK